MSVFDYFEKMPVIGDCVRLGVAYNQRKCHGLILLVAYYLGDEVVPIEYGIHGIVPVIFVMIDGLDGVFRIYEIPRHDAVGKVNYLSNFDFSNYVDTRPSLNGYEFLLMI